MAPFDINYKFFNDSAGEKPSDPAIIPYKTDITPCSQGVNGQEACSCTDCKAPSGPSTVAVPSLLVNLCSVVLKLLDVGLHGLNRSDWSHVVDRIHGNRCFIGGVDCIFLGTLSTSAGGVSVFLICRRSFRIIACLVLLDTSGARDAGPKRRAGALSDPSTV